MATIKVPPNRPYEKNFDVYRGDDFDFSFTFDIAGLADLVDHDFKMKIVNTSTNTEFETLEIGSGITVVGLTVTPALTSDQTKAMDGLKYKYDLQWVKDTGKVKTLFVGTLNPFGDITPET